MENRAEGETEALGLNLSLEMGPSPSAALGSPRWASVKGEARDRASEEGPNPREPPPRNNSPGRLGPSIPSPLVSPPAAGTEPHGGPSSGTPRARLLPPESRATHKKQESLEAQEGGRGPHLPQGQDQGEEVQEAPELPREAAPGYDGRETGQEPQSLQGPLEDRQGHGWQAQGENWGASPPPPQGSAKRASPAAETEGLNSSRKVLKADREKLRRDKLNEQFLELAGVLDPDRPKNDKATILGDSLTVLHELRGVVGQLRAENKTLREEAKELAQEKMELKAEGATLRSDVAALESQVQETEARGALLPPWYAVAAPDQGGVAQGFAASTPDGGGMPGGYAAAAPEQGPGGYAAAAPDQCSAEVGACERGSEGQAQQGSVQGPSEANAPHPHSTTGGMQFQLPDQHGGPCDGPLQGVPRAWQPPGQPSMLPLLRQSNGEWGGEALPGAGQGKDGDAGRLEQQQGQGQQQGQQQGQPVEAWTAGERQKDGSQGAEGGEGSEAPSQAQAQPQALTAGPYLLPQHFHHSQDAQPLQALQMLPFFAPPAAAAAAGGGPSDSMPSGQPLWTQQLLPSIAGPQEHSDSKPGTVQQQQQQQQQTQQETGPQMALGAAPMLMPAGGGVVAGIGTDLDSGAGREGATNVQGMQHEAGRGTQGLVRGPAPALVGAGSQVGVSDLGLAGAGGVTGPRGAVVPNPLLYSFPMPVPGAMPQLAQGGLLPGGAAPAQLVLAGPQGAFALQPMGALRAAGAGGVQAGPGEDEERARGAQAGEGTRGSQGRQGSDSVQGLGAGTGTGTGPLLGAGSSSGAVQAQSMGPLLMAQPFPQLPGGMPAQMALVPHYLGLVAIPQPQLCESTPRGASGGPSPGPLLYSQPFLAFPSMPDGMGVTHYSNGLALGAPSVYPASALQSPLLVAPQPPSSSSTGTGAAAPAQGGAAGGTPGQVQVNSGAGAGGGAAAVSDVAALPLMFAPGGAVGVHPGMLAAGSGVGPFWSLAGAGGAAGAFPSTHPGFSRHGVPQGSPVPFSLHPQHAGGAQGLALSSPIRPGGGLWAFPLPEGLAPSASSG